MKCKLKVRHTNEDNLKTVIRVSTGKPINNNKDVIKLGININDLE